MRGLSMNGQGTLGRSGLATSSAQSVEPRRDNAVARSRSTPTSFITNDNRLNVPTYVLPNLTPNVAHQITRPAQVIHGLSIAPSSAPFESRSLFPPSSQTRYVQLQPVYLAQFPRFVAPVAPVVAQGQRETPNLVMSRHPGPEFAGAGLKGNYNRDYSVDAIGRGDNLVDARERRKSMDLSPVDDDQQPDSSTPTIGLQKGPGTSTTDDRHLLAQKLMREDSRTSSRYSPRQALADAAVVIEASAAAAVAALKKHPVEGMVKESGKRRLSLTDDDQLEIFPSESQSGYERGANRTVSEPKKMKRPDSSPMPESDVILLPATSSSDRLASEPIMRSGSSVGSSSSAYSSKHIEFGEQLRAKWIGRVRKRAAVDAVVEDGSGPKKARTARARSDAGKRGRSKLATSEPLIPEDIVPEGSLSIDCSWSLLEPNYPAETSEAAEIHAAAPAAEETNHPSSTAIMTSSPLERGCLTPPSELAIGSSVTYGSDIFRPWTPLEEKFGFSPWASSPLGTPSSKQMWDVFDRSSVSGTPTPVEPPIMVGPTFGMKNGAGKTASGKDLHLPSIADALGDWDVQSNHSGASLGTTLFGGSIGLQKPEDALMFQFPPPPGFSRPPSRPSLPTSVVLPPLKGLGERNSDKVPD